MPTDNVPSDDNDLPDDASGDHGVTRHAKGIAPGIDLQAEQTPARGFLGVWQSGEGSHRKGKHRA